MIAWCKDAIDRLERKSSRDRNYLERRAARGTRTPTDEALEQDQLLLAELIVFLQEALAGALQVLGDDEG